MTPPAEISALAKAARLASVAASVIAECRLIATFTEELGQTTRRFLSPPVREVHRHLRRRMESLGMEVRVDPVGNLRGLWTPPGKNSERRLLIGSHIDTVPDAGAFDGILGVVMALELVAQAPALNLSYGIEVIAFSEEEGVRFGVPFLGSRAVAGRFHPDLLQLQDRDGISVSQAIADFGLDPTRISDCELAPQTFAFLELHIEQGPILDSKGSALGVVTGIVGQSRCAFQFSGKANHAGTTPMALRHDALAAAAQWIAAVESITGRARYSPAGEPALIATVGKLEVKPNAANVIPGEVTATLDLRHARDDLRQAALADLIQQAEAIALRRGVTCQVRTILDQPAIPMDEQLTSLLSESVTGCGNSLVTLPSGAGHDAMILASRVPAAMLFLRSPGGISHHPSESVLEPDIASGLAIGQDLLQRLHSYCQT